jgi:sarcosine oxidase, subunit alpha
LAFDPRKLPGAPTRGDVFEFDFEGSQIVAHEGESIAEALLAAGVSRLSRSPKYHRPRGAFCFAGQCGTCLVRVNGRPNVRACTEPVFQHTRCERQNAFPDGDADILRASDWLFPGGMDHHHLMTGTKVGNDLFVKLVRQMGGTGTLPDAPETRFGEMRSSFYDVCVVGAGPAGLAAAITIKQRAPFARVVVVDQQKSLGGSLLAEPTGTQAAEEFRKQLSDNNVDLWLSSTALGHYPEDESTAPQGIHDAVPGVMAILRSNHIALLSARRFVFATGTYEQNLPFPSNDFPGVVAARALGRLVFARGILPTPKVTLLCDPELPSPYCDRLHSGLLQLGVQVNRLNFSEGQDVTVAGKTTLAVVALPAPAFELPRQHGVPCTMQIAAGGFAAQANADGSTNIHGVFVAGDVTGYVGPKNAETHGKAVGLAVGNSL